MERRSESNLNEAEAAAILDLLERQVRLYRALRRLVDRQRPMIVRDQTAPLLTLLAERQKLTAELGTLSAQLNRYRQDWARVREALSTPQRERAERQIGEVEQMVRGLLETDEADARLLGARKAATRQAMGELAVGHRAAAAYQQASHSTSRPSGSNGWSSDEAI